jgi:hypothetical protein
VALVYERQDRITEAVGELETLLKINPEHYLAEEAEEKLAELEQ